MKFIMHRGFVRYIPEDDWDERFLRENFRESDWVTPQVPCPPVEGLWRYTAYARWKIDGYKVTLD